MYIINIYYIYNIYIYIYIHTYIDNLTFCLEKQIQQGWGKRVLKG